MSATHPKHRRALSIVEASNQRARNGRTTSVVVPVCVRIEAGWDRTGPSAALINRISRARDVVVDGRAANMAAPLRVDHDVSVVDATVAHVALSAAPPVVVITSDVEDMKALTRSAAGDVRVLRI